MNPQNQSTTLPRGFRYHSEPRTPEPEPSSLEPCQPSPPRPRLKFRRRNASNAEASTNNFLASVAAADNPVPTIEEPQVTAAATEDFIMPDRESLSIDDTGLLSPNSFQIRLGSPPKTPVPMLSNPHPLHRPDWAVGALSDDYFSRPHSVLSDISDSSDDSNFYGSGVSRLSEDGNCTSPDSDHSDPFQLPSLRISGKGKSVALDDLPFQRSKILTSKVKGKGKKTSAWTKAMDNHLMATLLLYIQDPTVTPIRLGPNSIPPDGVCCRVAREAKRSWKGVEPRRSPRLMSPVNGSEESGSRTPTLEGMPGRAHASWPHALAATRTHLRELCKRNGAVVTRHRYMKSRSPTPFSKEVEGMSTSGFSTSDVAVSLATSTSESLQPNGPLASLALSRNRSESPALGGFGLLNFGDVDIEDGNATIRSSKSIRAKRLGSPGLPNTYGPSSSENVPRSRPTVSQSKSHSGSLKSNRPQLASPFEPYPLTNTMKRRAQISLDRELSPSGAVVRPSILNEALYGTPFKSSARRVRSRGYSLGDEALRNGQPGLFHSSSARSRLTTQFEDDSEPTILPSVKVGPPPRLGSPFHNENGPSQTFPRRMLMDNAATIRRSGYASMHQARRSIESFDFGRGPSLHSRLSRLNGRLDEIREREGTGDRDGNH